MVLVNSVYMMPMLTIGHVKHVVIILIFVENMVYKSVKYSIKLQICLV